MSDSVNQEIAGSRDRADHSRQRSDLEPYQLERFRTMAAEIAGRNPFWTRRFEAAGVDPVGINDWEAFRAIPFVTKAELVADQAESPPYGTNLTYELTRYSRLHQTSGTTGRPMRWLDTPASWDWFMECWRQIFASIGLRESDRLFFPFSFGPFIGFWAGFEGANRLGNLCIPGGGMSSEARLQMLLDNSATIVCCTPTYALRLAEVAAEKGIDLAAGSVRALIVAGEPGGGIPATKERIERGWGARVFDHWGMTEIGALAVEPENAPGTLAMLQRECIAEVVDPVTGAPVEPGQMGELIITNLGRWGTPLIRYRTGDLVVPEYTETATALGMMRLKGGILGRVDDMVTIRGNNVFPSSLEAILREFASVVEYRIEVRTERAMQHLRIEIEPADTLAEPAVKQLLVEVGRAVKDRLNFNAEVAAVAPASLPRFELKGRRFIRVEPGESQATG